MKITRVLGALGVAGLALVACSPSQEEQMLRDGWGCADDESLDECEQRVGDEAQASLDESVAERDAAFGSPTESEPSEEARDVPAPTESNSANDVRNAESVDDLYVDIYELDSCETADTIWGGLMNAELEGEDIDHQYLAELERWMEDSLCW